jgi:hypothetical protein
MLNSLDRSRRQLEGDYCLNWHDVLPPPLASQQEAWERNKAIARAYAAPGATLKSVGESCGLSKERVRQCIARSLRQERAPIEKYLDRCGVTSKLDAVVLLKGLAGGFRVLPEEEAAEIRAWEQKAEAYARERKERYREQARRRAIEWHEENKRQQEEARKRQEAYLRLTQAERTQKQIESEESLRALEQQVANSIMKRPLDPAWESMLRRAEEVKRGLGLLPSKANGKAE